MSTDSMTSKASDGPAAMAVGPSQETLLSRLRGVVLLAGQVRSTPLIDALNRSVLDLPVTGERRVIDIWHEQVSALANQFELSDLPMRLLINDRAASPTPPARDDRVAPRVEQDAGEFRGTGGALRDAAIHYDDDDWLLLANGGQLLVQPLADIVETLCNQQGDVRLVAHADGTPCGLMLVRCGVLEMVSSVGFVDFKEQALPRIAERHRVQVVDEAQPVGMPVRTRNDYLMALYRFHGASTRAEMANNPFRETWQRTFSIIEPGATVSEEARIHDSVILRGAHVGPGAVVSRSVVCEAARVTRGRRAVERVMRAAPSARRNGDG